MIFWEEKYVTPVLYYNSHRSIVTNHPRTMGRLWEYLCFNRSIRNQACIALIGRSKDDEERKQIAESFAGEISPDTFLKVHYEATKDSNHDFLYVDLHPKEPHMRFRKNFDQYLIVDEDT